MGSRGQSHLRQNSLPPFRRPREWARCHPPAIQHAGGGDSVVAGLASNGRHRTRPRAVSETTQEGLLGRYPVAASGFHLIGKETERGWEQAEDISTLLPSLVRYEQNTGTPKRAIQQRLKQISLDTLEKETVLSRHTILRARRGERVHPRSLQRLRIAAGGHSRSQTVTKAPQ